MKRLDVAYGNEANKLFDSMDTNGDGVVDHDEFRNAIDSVSRNVATW